jgi:excisionase family DNA binding protein
MSEDEILTIREVAEFLKVGEKTTYTMAQSGHKVRGQWRFRRADIESWITHHVAGVRCDKKKGATGGKG